MKMTPPTTDHPWGTPDLGLALAETYLLFREAAEQCPTGPTVSARDNLAEAMHSFGYFPSEVERIIAEHKRVENCVR